MIKIWVDDIRMAPCGYDKAFCSVNGVINYLQKFTPDTNIFLNLDHDAGDFAELGGDYYKILDWCEAHHYNPVVHIHSMNVVGRMNMEAICRRNGWKIVE